MFFLFRRRSLNEKVESEVLPQLPDALLLLESPTLTHVSGGGGDHASVVAAAMRKRDLNGNSSSLPRRPKVPRGALPHSKNTPDTMGNLLVPPQLKGRLVDGYIYMACFFFNALPERGF